MNRGDGMNAPWEFTVAPICRDDQLELSSVILDQLHAERMRAGLTRAQVANIIDVSASTIYDARRIVRAHRLDTVCGFAYAVRKRLVLVPWDATSS